MPSPSCPPNVPPAETYHPGDLIVLRYRRRPAVRVVAVHHWPGAVSGYLVEHDGPGVPCVDGLDVRPFKG